MTLITEVQLKRMGAYNDGTHPIPTRKAIQEALDSIGQGLINFGVGKYLIDEPLIMKSGITLSCLSNRSAIIMTDQNIPIISSDPDSYLYLPVINNLGFKNNHPTVNGQGSTQFHIVLHNPLHANLNRIHTLSNFIDGDYHKNNRAGIHITASLPGCFMNVIQNSWVQNGSILMETSDSKINKTWVWGHTCEYGVKLNNGNISITNCDLTGARGNGSIYLTEKAVSCRVNGGWFDGAAGTGAVSGNGIYAVGAAGLIVNGATFWGQKERAIYMKNCRSFNISGNHFVDNNHADNGYPDIEIINGTANMVSTNTFLQNSPKTNMGVPIVESGVGNVIEPNTELGYV